MTKTQRIVVLLLSGLCLLIFCGGCFGGWGCRASSSDTLGNVSTASSDARAAM